VVQVSNISITAPNKKRKTWPDSIETSAEPDTGIISLTVTLELKAEKFTSVVT